MEEFKDINTDNQLHKKAHEKLQYSNKMVLDYEKLIETKELSKRIDEKV